MSDSTDDREEVNRICTEYMPLTRAIAKRHAQRFPSLGIDLESEAMLGLWAAARHRHVWRTEFASLVWLNVTRRCVRLITRERARPDGTARDGAVSSEVGWLIDEADWELRETGPELQATIADLLNTITAKQRARIVRKFFGGASTGDLAADALVSQETIRAMLEADLATLRATLRDTIHGGE